MYIILHSLLDVVVEIENKLGLQKMCPVNNGATATNGSSVFCVVCVSAPQCFISRTIPAKVCKILLHYTHWYWLCLIDCDARYTLVLAMLAGL
jgi:hypothetical protein